jgi:hypothetical protein
MSSATRAAIVAEAWRWLGTPYRHQAIVSGDDRIIHAYWGRAACETRLVPWCRRSIAAAFQFPGVET